MAVGDGLQRRMRRVLPHRGALILPVDGGLIDGPLGALKDPFGFFQENLLSNVDAILGFRGLLSACSGLLDGTPFIVNLSASTALSSHTHKRLVGTVEAAVRSGADAVGFQLHLSDPKEGDMLADLGRVVDEADSFGMPVMVIAYPRKGTAEGDNNYHQLRATNLDRYALLVSHAVRVAVEMGANIVKTHYTGTRESFREVVKAACGVPIVVAGGPHCSDAEAEAKAVCAISAGAWGIAYGRQIFMHSDPAAITERLRRAVNTAVANEGGS